MKKIVEKMSKDLQTWVSFAEYPIPEESTIIFDEHYHNKKLALIMQGWRFWRTEIKS